MGAGSVAELAGGRGIGGLLMQEKDDAAGQTKTRLYTYEANGNVGQLVDGTTGAVVAHYDYDPFGTTLTASGTAANANPFRFSTKYTDDDTTLLYYGYRFYSPYLGRWLTRDPIEEEGGLNLYGFVRNYGVNGVDVDGRLLWLSPNELKSFINLPWVSDAGEDTTAFAKDKATDLAQFVGKRLEVLIQARGSMMGVLENDLKELFITGVAIYGVYQAEGLSGLGEQFTPNLHQIITTDDLSSRESRRAITNVGLEIGITLLLSKCPTKSPGAPANAAKYQGTLPQIAKRYMDFVYKNKHPNVRGPKVVSVLVDTKTLQIYFGQSGIKLPYSEISPTLLRRMPLAWARNKTYETFYKLLRKEVKNVPFWYIRNCAEFNALNFALKAGAELKNLVGYTLHKNRGPYPRCSNCRITTRGVFFYSD